MKIGLVDPFIFFEFHLGNFEPLGLLSIAAVAEKAGHIVEIIQLRDFLPKEAPNINYNMLPQTFSQTISDKSFDIVGFSTRCDTLPLAIEVARRYKSKHENVPIIMGGPGASFADVDILEAFSFIDFIIRGEGEETFIEFLSSLESKHKFATINGLTYRNDRGEPARAPDRPKIHDIDSLPDFPYHLIEDRLANTKLKSINILVGRGCPNNCTFCSTRSFWGPKVRMRSPEKLIAEMKFLHTKYGMKDFALVHDNLFCHRKFLRKYCALVQKSLPGITWGASASLNFCSHDVIKMVKRSGCNAVYMGIETVSERTSHNIPQKYHAITNSEKLFKIFRKYHIKVTRSFIIGFPYEGDDEINDTLRYAIKNQALASYKNREVTQIHPLTILPGTDLYRRFGDKLHYSKSLGDMSDPFFQKIDSCLEICKKHPAIFASCATHLPELRHRKIVEICNFYALLLMFFAKSTQVVLHELNLTPTQFFQHFKRLAETNHVDLSPLKNQLFKLEGYQTQETLFINFPKITRKLYKENNQSETLIETFLRFEASRVYIKQKTKYNLISEEILNGDVLFEHAPVLPSSTRMVAFECNPEELFKAFVKRKSQLFLNLSYKKNYLYFIPRDKITNREGIAHLGIQKLNGILSRILPLLIDRIDGRRSCYQIVDDMVSIFGLPGTKLFMRREIRKYLKLLIKGGILLLSPELDINV
ncbi:MAG: B12-binding domain-containing radical SAM protein [Planctomycetota bacterium]|jgi:radical SAM superfamily enzyme YgiQ (UPF0313 family)